MLYYTSIGEKGTPNVLKAQVIERPMITLTEPYFPYFHSKCRCAGAPVKSAFMLR